MYTMARRNTKAKMKTTAKWPKEQIGQTDQNGQNGQKD